MGQAFAAAGGGRGALLMKGAESSDFVSRPGVLSIGQHPSQDFAIPEALGDLGLEGFGVDPEEVQDVLVQGAVIGVLPVLPGEGGTRFVEHAGEDD